MRNIVSLFDGIGVAGMLYPDDNIYAYEIDKYALMVTRRQQPGVHHLGDVRDPVGYGFNPYILLAGSPCTNVSRANPDLGIEVYDFESYIKAKERGLQFKGESYLFWEFIRHVNESKPEYFLLENVPMSKKNLADMVAAIGWEPFEIDAVTFTGQRRRRLFWLGRCRSRMPGPSAKLSRTYTPMEVPPPHAPTPTLKHMLKDLEPGDVVPRHIEEVIREMDQMFPSAYSRKQWRVFSRPRGYFMGGSYTYCPTITASSWWTNHFLWDGFLRYFTPEQAERLQGIPTGWTALGTKKPYLPPVRISKTQRFRLIGNAWCVPVIRYILDYHKLL